MSDDFTIDTSQIRRLALDLAVAGATVSAGVHPIVTKGALKIKNDMRREMEGSPSFKGVAPAISYDVTTTPTAVEAQIGPKRGDPGSLANIAYFGGSRGGGTVPDPQGALDREAPNVEAAIVALMRGVL